MTKTNKLKRLTLFGALMAVMLMAALPAAARDYVITWTNDGTTYYVGMNGNNIAVKTEFDITCVWTCRNGNNDADLSNNTSYSLRNKNNTTYYLTTSCSRSGTYGRYTYTWSALTVQNGANTIWRSSNGTNGNVYAYVNGYTRSASIRVVNDAWAMRDNNTDGSQNSQVTTTTPGASSPTTAEIGTLTVTPVNAALYQNENETFTASASVTIVTNSIPAHTKYTYTIGETDYEYFYYNNTLYTSTDDFSTKTTTTQTPSYAWTKTGDDGSNASLSSTNASSTTVTHATQVTTEKSISLTVTASYSGAESKTATVTVILYGPMVAPTITRSVNSISIATTNANATIYYTTDGSTPSASSTPYTGSFDLTTSPTTVKAIAIRDGNNSTVATETFNMQLPTPVISLTGAVATVTAGEGTPSGTKLYYTVNGTTPTASSTLITSGNTVTLTNPQIIQVIAVLTGYDNSEVAVADYIIEGVSGTNVILDDRENHNWSYYSDATLPEMTRSLNPADVKITYYGDGIVMSNNSDYTAGTSNYVSPGNTNYVGGAKVNVGGENENTFVYFKTLERGDATDDAWTFSSGNQSSAASRCPYTPIYNPFQVRPTYGARGTTDANDFTGWRGFQCWRLKSVTGGAVYSAASGGTALATGAIINAGTEIYFAPNSEYGMEVQLEAVWARAYVIKGNQGGANAILNYGNLGVERNFMTLTANENYRFNGASGRRITNVDRAVTISCYYPNGEAPDNTSGVVTGNNNDITLSTATKFENVRINVGGNSITASGYDLIIGRGCTSSTAGTVYGNNANSNINQTVRIESGTYTNFYPIGTNGPGNNVTKQHIILGSDYDRAKKDDAKIKITDYIKLIQTESHSTGTDKVIIWVKSGTYQDNQGTGTAENSNNCFYLWSPSQNTAGTGTRTMIVEGGQLWHIAGGLDCGNAANSLNLTLRVSGGTIRGSVFGGAARYDTKGYKQFIFTGGTVRGWIAGGSNGYLAAGTYGSGTEHGTVDGKTYIYVGGTTSVGGREDAINMSIGGYVFGAGCGNTNANTNAGSVTDETNVVIADEANVKHGVYGGGAYGSSLGTANVYVLGNAVVDGDNDNVQNVIGGVYGGARQKGGGTVNITMNGGTINKGGLFGGSNATGTISGSVTMNINGGQVGTSSSTANIHGGGYGQPTRVTQNVDITLGTVGQTEPGVTVYGDVYGGSALGYVNGESATNTYHTYVTLNAGTINGSLYGGGLGAAGTAANVYGPVQVKVYGGSVNKTDANGANGSGGVYGANNVNGAPQRSVTVDIYGTDPAPAADAYALYSVYGGGNQADYTYGNGYPTVKVHNCNNSIEYVYGGGNAAAVAATDVTIYGGNKIGNVFGGGNGTVTAANVTGNVAAKIYGGIIGKVFGGSNSQGTIGGTIKVRVDKQGDSDPAGQATACDMKIGELYGGGNMAASAAGTITIGCTGDSTAAHASSNSTDNRIGYELEGIGDVYGGANAADITSGNIAITIDSGMVNRVFGGNNTSGTISGTITVTINKTANSCGWYCGEVYGGGNQAAYSGTPDVNIIAGTVERNVFGGGNNIASGGVAGGDVAMTGGLVKGNLFGGCNVSGTVSGTTSVKMSAGTVGVSGSKAEGCVYGGGLGSDTDVTGKATVEISGSAKVINDVFGGGSQGTVGSTQVTIKD